MREKKINYICHGNNMTAEAAGGREGLTWMT